MKLALVIAWLAALALAYALGTSATPAPGSIASLERALEHRNPLQRSAGLSEFLLGLNSTNIDAVRTHVEGQAYWFTQREYELLMDAWVRFDTLAAVDWASTRPALLKQRASIGAIRALGFHNPGAGRSMLEYVDPGLLDPMFYAFVDGWAWSERKDELTSYLSQLPTGARRRRGTSMLARTILSGGIDELIAWVDQLPTGTGFKLIAFQQSVDAITQIDPPRAAKWVGEHVGQRYAQEGPSLVTRRWFELDPAAAMDWLITLPGESSQPQRVLRTFRRWLNREPQEARAWVMASTPNPVIDPAVRELVRRDLKGDPASAMDWAHRVADPVKRLSIQRSAGRRWYEKDREAFMEWLPESGLESQARSLILNAAPGSLTQDGSGDDAEDPAVRDRD